MKTRKATTILEYRIRIERSPLACDGVEGEYLENATAVRRVARVVIPDDEREHFVVFFLDSKHRVKGFNEVSTGSLSYSLVHPREAFRAAVGIGAHAVIFFHNHPSGDPKPSREDEVLTQRLWEAGAVLGITVLDHVILGDGSDHLYSYADDGNLPPCAPPARQRRTG